MMEYVQAHFDKDIVAELSRQWKKNVRKTMSRKQCQKRFWKEGRVVHRKIKRRIPSRFCQRNFKNN